MNRFRVKAISTLICLYSFSAHAQSEAGGEFKFHLPSSQELESVFGRENPPESSSAEQKRAYGIKYCPLVSQLIFKIADRIYDANHLREKLDPSAPALKVNVECFKVKQTGQSLNPGATAHGIHIPASIAERLVSEDQIAFMIAHEISHVLLEHYNTAPEARKSQLPPAPWVNQSGNGSPTEKEADGLATILIANSGYDPRAATEAFCRLESGIRDIPWIVPCEISNYMPEISHGSVWDRSARIEMILSQINYPKSPKHTTSKELNDARAEVIQMRKKSDSKR